MTRKTRFESSFYSIGVSLLAFTLVSCGGTGGPEPETPSANELGGVAQNWIGEVATLKVEVSTATEEPNDSSVLEEATVSSSGSFTITLPSAATMAPLLAPFETVPCEIVGGTGTVRASPSPLQIGPLLNLNVYLAGSEDSLPDGYLSREKSLASSRVFVDQLYSATGGTIQGSCTFEHGATETTETYDMTLTAGWNEVVIEFTAFAATVVTKRPPEGIDWQYKKYEAPPAPPTCDPSNPDCEDLPPPCEPGNPECEPPPGVESYQTADYYLRILDKARKE